uniref:helix-turn-helix transcriptional regulator n=1 Tax=Ningiella ruwaisensis TaxID=2364274 RepID=UPI00109FC2A0|nr:LuxR C-terminal-related transcriptional regulator [Ningiella ruwaisensis]
MKDKIIAAILITIMLLNGADVLVDLSLNMPLWHIAQEASLVFLSGIGVILLVRHMHKRTIGYKRLKSDLDDAKKQINTLNGKIESERKRFAGVIKAQFDEWQLTSGEQQVALLLLKGLSLKEVSIVRNTKEATVRQQASSIYAKSNLEGRHEFAAWFLEDFLN